MKTFYQNIFNKQNVKEAMEAIDEFLKLYDDDNPYQELLNRRISDEIKGLHGGTNVRTGDDKGTK